MAVMEIIQALERARRRTQDGDALLCFDELLWRLQGEGMGDRGVDPDEGVAAMAQQNASSKLESTTFNKKEYMKSYMAKKRTK